MNPLLSHGHWLARFVPRRKEPSPTLDDLEIGPRLRNFGIKPQQNVQMIIQYRETTDGHGEDLRKFLESAFKPLLAVIVSFSEQGRLANTARHAVVPASQRQINQFRSSDRHGKSPVGYYDILYAMPEDSSRSVDLLVFKNQHRDRSSLVRHGREAMKCVSFPSRDRSSLVRHGAGGYAMRVLSFAMGKLVAVSPHIRIAGQKRLHPTGQVGLRSLQHNM